MSDTELRDENLRHLASLQNLKFLYLGDTGLGDSGLAVLATLQGLEYLSIDDLYSHRKSQYTSSGVAQLAALPNLQKLDLEEP